MGSSIGFRERAELEKEKTIINIWHHQKIISYADALTTPHRLLFLGYSGSILHGTNNEQSDVDIKGVFLPSMESCCIGNPPDVLTYSSNDSKNTKDDIDITLWSLQKWFGMLERGDTNALSLLFSSINSDMLIYVVPEMVDILSKGYYLFDPNNVKSFTGFSRGQATKNRISKSGDINWKALSHSLRTLMEAKELLTNGYINYPLSSKTLLKSIKSGEMSEDEYDQRYFWALEDVEEAKMSTSVESQHDMYKKNRLIMNLYLKGETYDE